MDAEQTQMQEKYAEKIAKLLARAEHTTHQAEAEACIAKAQELMTQYAIEQAMIDQARGIERDEIEQRKVWFTGNWRRELADILSDIASVNGCKCVQYPWLTHDDGGRKAVKVRPQWDGTYKAEVTSQKKAIMYEVTGFRSDLERVVLLETSIRLQATGAMVNWWNTEGKRQYDWETYSRKVRIRGEFLEAFRTALYAKLRAAKAAGRSAAIKTEAERTGQAEQQASDSVALVLRSRKDRVDDWYNHHYGDTLRNVRRGYKQALSGSARAAGHAAGQRADIGQTGVGGKKGALSR